MSNVTVRETTFREYSIFTKQLVDKCQLAYPKTILLLQGSKLIAIKYNFNQNFKDILDVYELQDNIEIINIAEFNKAITKDKNKIKVKKEYYEGKNFIITDVQL